MNGPVTGRPALLVVSIISAIFLWLHVMSQGDPTKQREIVVDVVLQNKPPNLMATSFPRTIKVTAEGPEKLLNEINSDALEAFIDLSNAQTGLRSYPVLLKSPAGQKVNFTARKKFEGVQLEKVGRKEWIVEIEARGKVNQDLLYQGATPQPERVIIFGPKTQIEQVRKVRASLDLSKIRPATSYNLPVEILDQQNRPIALTEADPPTVTVLPAVAAAPSTKNVLVGVNWKGQPAFGYRIVSVDVQPNQLMISGKSALLSGVSSVFTEPINVSDLTQTQTFSAKVELPKGVTTNKSAEVRVIVTIEKTENAPN